MSCYGCQEQCAKYDAWVDFDDVPFIAIFLHIFFHQLYIIIEYLKWVYIIYTQCYYNILYMSVCGLGKQYNLLHITENDH